MISVESNNLNGILDDENLLQQDRERLIRNF
jgi:hypothetical protein